MDEVFKKLSELGIAYVKYDHSAVFTVEDSHRINTHAEGLSTKNLFLRNKKGDHHYLVVVSADKRVDLNALSQLLHEDRLSFASPERLKQYLQLTPGSVSPFGLIYSSAASVRVIVDEDIFYHYSVGFHPNINTATLVITSADFKKFLESSGNEILYFVIPQA